MLFRSGMDDQPDDAGGEGEGDGLDGAVDIHGRLVHGPGHGHLHGAREENLWRVEEGGREGEGGRMGEEEEEGRMERGREQERERRRSVGMGGGSLFTTAEFWLTHLLICSRLKKLLAAMLRSAMLTDACLLFSVNCTWK